MHNRARYVILGILLPLEDYLILLRQDVLMDIVLGVAE